MAKTPKKKATEPRAKAPKAPKTAGSNKASGDSKRAAARKAAMENGRLSARTAADRIVELLERHGDMKRSRLMQYMTNFERAVRESALGKLIDAKKVTVSRVETGMRGRPAEVFAAA